MTQQSSYQKVYNKIVPTNISLKILIFKKQMSSQNQQQQKVLYWNMGSQPGRAVKALVDIGRIKCKLVSIDLMSRQQKSEQFLEKYSLGKIPFFTKGTDIKIGQSNAIMIYLYETQQGIPRHYYGQTPQQRAKVNQYLSWYQAYFRPKMFKPVMMFLGSFLMGKPIYQNQKIDSINEVHEALKELDKLLGTEWEISHGNFICGTELPTIADLLVFFQTTNIIFFGIDHHQYQNLAKWYKSVYSINQVKTITHQWYSIGKQFNEMFSQVQVVKSKL